MFTNRIAVDVIAGRHQPGLRRRRGARFLPERRASARTTRGPRRPASRGDDESYQGKFDWSPDRYGVQRRGAEGRQGTSIRRSVSCGATDFTRSFASARFSPRPTSARSSCASSRRRAASSTSRTAPATVESRQQPAASTSSSTTATSSPSRPTPTTSCCSSRSRRRRRRPIPRRRLSLQRRVDVATTSASSAALSGNVGVQLGQYLQRHDHGARRSRRRARTRSSSSSRSSRACRSTTSSCRPARSRRG